MEDIQVLRTFDITCSRLLKVTYTLVTAGKSLSQIDSTIAVSLGGGFTDNMTGTFIGYARCSIDKQDLAAQRTALETLGVASDRVYVDHGLSGTSPTRPGLDQALAAVRAGDTLVVPKLDRLARSVPDARAIATSFLPVG